MMSYANFLYWSFAGKSISLWNTQDHQHTVLGTCMRVLPLNVFASSLINRSRIAEEGEMVINGHKSLRTKEK